MGLESEYEKAANDQNRTDDINEWKGIDNEDNSEWLYTHL